jgi:hypothetical protein
MTKLERIVYQKCANRRAELISECNGSQLWKLHVKWSKKPVYQVIICGVPVKGVE